MPMERYNELVETVTGTLVADVPRIKDRGRKMQNGDPVKAVGGISCMDGSGAEYLYRLVNSPVEYQALFLLSTVVG